MCNFEADERGEWLNESAFRLVGVENGPEDCLSDEQIVQLARDAASADRECVLHALECAHCAAHVESARMKLAFLASQPLPVVRKPWKRALRFGAVAACIFGAALVGTFTPAGSWFNANFGSNFLNGSTHGATLDESLIASLLTGQATHALGQHDIPIFHAAGLASVDQLTVDQLDEAYSATGEGTLRVVALDGTSSVAVRVLLRSGTSLDGLAQTHLKDLSKRTVLYAFNGPPAVSALGQPMNLQHQRDMSVEPVAVWLIQVDVLDEWARKNWQAVDAAAAMLGTQLVPQIR